MSTTTFVCADISKGILRQVIEAVKDQLVEEQKLTAEQIASVPPILLESRAKSVAKNVLYLTHAVITVQSPSAQEALAVVMYEAEFNPDKAISSARESDALNEQARNATGATKH